MKTLKQLKSIHIASQETAQAIQAAIKDYGDSMAAMLIIGRNSYDRGDRVAIETGREGVEAVEIYPGPQISKNIYVNVVVVNNLC